MGEVGWVVGEVFVEEVKEYYLVWVGGVVGEGEGEFWEGCVGGWDVVDEENFGVGDGVEFVDVDGVILGRGGRGVG